VQLPDGFFDLGFFVFQNYLPRRELEGNELIYAFLKRKEMWEKFKGMAALYSSMRA
jgi:hypothetical protein